MKTKMQDPEFMAQLTLNAYKSRLETDLENLKKETEEQPFLLITEYKFADKNEAPLLVVGLTPAWRDYVKSQVKDLKNPHFVSGECQFVQEAGKEKLKLELHRGKAKPAAITKAFKKYSALKQLELTFVEMEDMEEGLAESLTELSEVKSKPSLSNLFKKDSYDIIKKKVAAYKELNPLDTEGRRAAIHELLGLIKEWQGKHANPKGNDLQIAQALATLDQQLRQQLIRTDQTQDHDSFYTILEEFNQVKGLDLDAITTKEVEAALKECDDVTKAIATWKTEHEGVNTPAIERQRQRIQPIEQRLTQIIITLNNKKNSAVRVSSLMTPGAFLKEVGVSLKDSGQLAGFVQELENLHTAKDMGGKTIDQQMTEAIQKAENSDPQGLTALRGLIDEKIARMRAIQTEAEKWYKDLGKEFKGKAQAGLVNLAKSMAKEMNELLLKQAELQSQQALRETKKSAQDNLNNRLADDLKKANATLNAAREALGDQTTSDEDLFYDAKLLELKKKRVSEFMAKEENKHLSPEEAEKQALTDEALQRLKDESAYETVNFKQAQAYQAGNLDLPAKQAESLQGLRALMQYKRKHDSEVQTNVAYMFRGNSLQSAAVTEVVKELGDSYATHLSSALEEIAVKQDEHLEVDPNKEPDPKKRAAAVARISLFYKELVRSFAGLEAIEKMPAGLKDYCVDIYQTAINEGAQANEAEDLIGGIIFLRFINPLIMQMAVRYTGKNNQRTFMILNKLLQNQANRVVPGGEKEPFMSAFAEVSQEMQKAVSLFIKGLVGTLTPTEKAEAQEERDKLTNQLFMFAKNNPKQRDEFFRKIQSLSLYEYLRNPLILPIFRRFCEMEFSTENLECRLAMFYKEHLKQPQAFLNKFVLDRDAINIPNGVFTAFDTAIKQQEQLSNKPMRQFGAAEWGVLVQGWTDAFNSLQIAVEGNLGDTWARFGTALRENTKFQASIWE